MIKSILRSIKNKIISNKFFIGFLYKLSVKLQEIFYSKYSGYNFACYQNNNYGIEQVLKKYAGYNKPIKAYVEHGYYFYTLPEQKTYKLKNIICFSNYMRTKDEKQRIPIGPYIAYVKGKKTKNKKKYLLIVPGHSSKTWKYNNQLKIFTSFINKNKWLKKMPKKILTNDSNIVPQKIPTLNCGNIDDKDHLIKLKTLLAQTRILLTDTCGTIIPYADYLKIPVILLRNQNQFNVNDKFEINTFAANKKEITKKENMLYKLFSKNQNCNKMQVATFNIKSKIYKIKSQLFGYKFVKSKKELKKIFESLND